MYRYVENKWFLETRIMQYPAMKIAVLLGACLELFLKQQMFTNILNATFIPLEPEPTKNGLALQNRFPET